MARKTGQEMFAKWRKNLVGAKDEMKRGVETTGKSQTKNAIAMKDVMIENHRKAIDNGSWEKGLLAAGDEKWKKNYIEKGLPKIGLGADANQSAIEASMEKVAQVGEFVSQEIAKMDKGGMANSVARVTRSMELTQQAHGKG